MKLLSIAGFAAMLAALLGLWEIRSLFSLNPGGIAVQLAAIILMIWARFTFGLRSFHATANPTAGGLVTSGPYRFIRHPIYASVCLFLWAGVLGNFSLLSFSLGTLGTAGALGRISCEEYLLLRQYPEYRGYAHTTKRLLPGLW